jgi:hypothetical protein
LLSWRSHRLDSSSSCCYFEAGTWNIVRVMHWNHNRNGWLPLRRYCLWTQLIGTNCSWSSRWIYHKRNQINLVVADIGPTKPCGQYVTRCKRSRLPSRNFWWLLILITLVEANWWWVIY